MDKCLNCDKEIIHTPGKRPKKFCGDNCRVKYSRKKSKPETITITKAKYEELISGVNKKEEAKESEKVEEISNKWKVNKKAPKPPSNLSHLQKLAWLSDWKKNNE